ncbi:Protein dopey-1 [Gossypium arboreum]|uniref:Protein dopey-1 n=1 Tax=Gossypium arboreum TaxID=29729 RepID=A0A0B0NS17_GOSAR|nr:Protein dopey-1 [Gossypium arboreum]
MSCAMNSTIMNDATYYKSCIPNGLLVPYLFELRFLLTLKYTIQIYIVRHPLKPNVFHTMNVTNE